ncbi:hypothetical protein AMJ49_02940 [Parcubacteria bacterium DG_74_2]|nr:MAG: hypothetical protein AMJ49_02940 [Parcubacteria bacterium DG_74_2]
MPSSRDFRTISPFSIDTVGISGRYIGKITYWKLYVIENLYRIILHSILSLQLDPTDWWSQATDENIQGRANRHRRDYLVCPWHTRPGQHDVYYIGLRDLNEIARANAEKLRVVIPKIDDFIVRVEMILLSRNVVAHMNFLNITDRNRVDIIYKDFKILTKVVQENIVLQVPQ